MNLLNIFTYSFILPDFLRRAALLITLACAVTSTNAYENEMRITFETNSGEKVEAFEGWLTVPENRQKANSRNIKINYVRFPAIDLTKKNAPPIVYLSGGPGGSGIGTAKRERFPLFMAMREFGDVIALDQRGLDEGRLPCQSSQKVPHDKVIDDARYTTLYKAALQECLGIWKEQGIDIYGYTTQESAHDLDALRSHLNADKISLWGISYGSHLAFASLKVMESRIDKVIVASVEGLDQTIKMPVRTDQYFDRLQKAINQDPTFKDSYPNIKQLIRDVHAQLDKAPLELELVKGDKTISTVFQKRDMQAIASGLIADPKRAFMLLDIYKGIQAGETDFLAQLLSQHTDPLKPISLSGMSVAMDIASGISEARYESVLQQAKTGLLADKLNFGMDHFDDIPGIDLGASFRNGPISKVPTLIFSGTLDGRTYVESQAEAAQGLSAATIVTVENAGHNLFMSSPEVTEVMQRFMSNQIIERTSINIDLVK